MKFAPPLFILAVLVALPGAAAAAPLDAKSKSPDWGRATQAEKDAWIAGFQFKRAYTDKKNVGQCVDENAGKPLFETNDLSGLTSLCELLAPAQPSSRPPGAPLDAKSVAPDWGRATQAEKDAWIAGFQFREADADKKKVGECVDKYSATSAFERTYLSDVTALCETDDEVTRANAKRPK